MGRVRGSVCGYIANTVALCADASFFRGDVNVPHALAGTTEVKESRSVYAGVLVGVLGW